MTTKTPKTTNPHALEPRQNRATWMAPNPRPSLGLAKLKTFKGMEGPGYNATLMVDGVAAAEVIDEGNGGSPIVRWSRTSAGRAAEAKVEEYVSRVEPIMCFGTAIAADIELLLGHLVETAKLEKGCKTSVIFEGADGNVYSMKGPYDTAARDRILAAHPEAVIFNEHFGQKAITRDPEEVARAQRDADVKAGRVVFKNDKTNGWVSLAKKMPLTDGLRHAIAAKYGAEGLVFHNDECAR